MVPHKRIKLSLTGFFGFSINDFKILVFESLNDDYSFLEKYNIRTLFYENR